jgi:hypothetical protein
LASCEKVGSIFPLRPIILLVHARELTRVSQ